MTQILRIKGGNALKGEVEIGGAKNAVLKLMAAALLPKGVTKIYNVPSLTDVNIMLNVIEQLGVKTAIAVADACKIEHDISPESFKAIKKLVKKNKTLSS